MRTAVISRTVPGLCPWVGLSILAQVGVELSFVGMMLDFASFSSCKSIRRIILGRECVADQRPTLPEDRAARGSRV